jgi:hypothetical protein
MKNILFTFCFLLIASLGFSQVKVFANGKTYIGNNAGITNPDGQLQVDGNATAEGLTVRRTGTSASAIFERDGGGFAAMVLGAGSNAGFTVDRDYKFEIRMNSRAAVLGRAISAGTRLITGLDDGTGVQGGMVGIGAVGTPQYKLHVAGDIFHTGSLIPSDVNLKNNVENFDYGLKEVLKMDVKEYNYNGKGGTSTKRRHVGVMAQDLKEIVPNLVGEYDWAVEDENGKVLSEEKYLNIDNDAIKFVLINAIQDQQAIIESKEERISELESKLTDLIEAVEELKVNGISGVNQTDVTLTSYDLASLEQNVPNPFNGQTTISYIIPTKANNAEIQIFDMNGKLFKTIPVSHIGEGKLNVNAQDLPSGSYTYNLIVDSRLIETKKMILSN